MRGLRHELVHAAHCFAAHHPGSVSPRPTVHGGLDSFRLLTRFSCFGKDGEGASVSCDTKRELARLHLRPGLRVSESSAILMGEQRANLFLFQLHRSSSGLRPYR
jgi:hypothetical protein